MFTVPERILLLNVLPPAEGPLLFLRAVRAFRESLGFTEAEVAEINLHLEPGPMPQQQRWAWDEAKAVQKEIEIGPMVAAYLSDCIQKSNGLREEYLDFYSRFIVEEK